MFAEVNGSMGSYWYDLSTVDSDGQRRNIQLIRSHSTEISNDRSIPQNSTLLTQLNDHHRKHDGSLSVEQVVNQNLSFWISISWPMSYSMSQMGLFRLEISSWKFFNTIADVYTVIETM